MPPVPARPLATPLSPHALRVLLLGAGELGKEVIISLQRLGVEVIAADRYANAPGHQVAHRAHVLNMADPQALRALVELERPHIIVPEIEAIATEELLAIERDGLAQVIPTARAANLTMNREGIRRLAAETLGLPTSPYRFADSLAQLQAAVVHTGLPCVIKPVMSSSGKGQSKVDRIEDLPRAWDHAMAGARVGLGRVIVEGFIDFDYEITQLTVRHRAADGSIATAFCEPIGHIQVNGDYVESWQPHPMRPTALAKARDFAQQVTADLGGLGVFGVELFVKGDDVWFSEVSPRPHDTGVAKRVRTACARPARPAGGHHAALAGRQQRHLWRRRGRRGGLRRRGRGAGAARHRPASVRQAGVVQQAPHGRDPGARR